MRLLATLAATLLATSALAQTPLADLAKPPADARQFSVVSSAGKHGTVAYWTAADGTHMSRFSMVLRGQVFEIDEAVAFGKDGMPVRYALRGFTPNGDAGETFAVTGDTATWKSKVDAGSKPYAAPAYYVPAGFGVDQTMVERLVAAPSHDLNLLPGGKAHIEKLTTAQVGHGASAKTVVAWAMTGISNTPIPVWLTEDGRYFGSVGGLGFLPAGYEDALPILEKAQDEALSKRSPELVRTLLKTPTGPVAFVDVRAFVDGTRFVEHQTVVVDKGVITSVGPASASKLNRLTQIIDGKGKTLVPGLWDAHMHFGDDSTGPMLLSLGVTSVRDPGNVVALTKARRERRAAGQLLSPHVYASTLIDGKGPNSAQSGTIVASQEEAIAAVRQAKADGQTGVKFYGTFDPKWLPAAAAEAHKLGLHVHGHVPAGMRSMQAIEAGYDEITHIYFVMMQAMPDAVVNASNGMMRFNGPGRYAKDIDLNTEPMKSLIATMAKRHIYSDPTLVVAENLYVPENGDLSPEYAPFLGTLPPAVERGFRGGGFVPPEGVTRADYRASFAKLRDLVGVMHKAGVPIVAGTDGSGLEIVRELELYVDAGFTPAEALAAGTQATADLVGQGKHTGSITVGKAADLVLVDGDPSKTIGDLRHTRVVMMDGQLMDADALRAAGGFAGRPKYMD